MHPARIAELLEPFLGAAPIKTSSGPCHSEERSDEEPAVLSAAQLQNISTYINLLRRWNARINLTAVRDPEQIVTRHFGESLFAARHLFPPDVRVGPGLRPGQAERSSAVDIADLEHRERAALQRRFTGEEKIGALAPEGPALADLGSGAGFPGVPIKLWAPEISLTLIESNHKKAAFLREVTRALTLTDVNIQTARAETLPAATFAVVTLRAVGRFATILPVAANLVAPGGRLALLISSTQLDQGASSLPHLSWSEPEPIPNSKSRLLAIAHRRS